jgi:hypothetical protein
MDQPGLLVALAKLLNDSLLFRSMEFSEPPLNITLLVVVAMWQASPLDFLPFISCHSILPNIAVGLATSMSLLSFFFLYELLLFSSHTSLMVMDLFGGGGENNSMCCFPIDISL